MNQDLVERLEVVIFHNKENLVEVRYYGCLRISCLY